MAQTRASRPWRRVAGLLVVVVASVLTVVAVAPPDLAAQVSPGRTERVSLNDDGGQAECAPSDITCSSASFDPDISASGRFVVFASEAALADADTNSRDQDSEPCDAFQGFGDCQTDIYRRDRDADADGILDEVGTDPVTGRGQTRTDLVSVGVPTLSVSSAVATEGDTLVFLVTLSAAAPPGGVSFRARTGDGDAIAGDDYTAVDRRFSIPAGQSSVQVSVATIEDFSNEDDELLTLNVSEVSGATAFSPIANGEIVDDDVPALNLRQPRRPTASISATEMGPQCFMPCGRDETASNPKTNSTASSPSSLAEPRLRRSARAAPAQAPPIAEQADAPSFDPVISADGRFVAFSSPASNLVQDQNELGDDFFEQDVFVRDMQSTTTYFVSVPGSFTGQGECATSPSISADGTVIAFLTFVPILEFGCEVAVATIADTTDPAAPVLTPITQQVDTDFDGEPDNAVPNPGPPALSANGRFVALAGFIANVEEDVLGVFDRDTGILSRVDAVDAEGELVGLFGMESEPAISGDGRYVAFESVPCFSFTPSCVEVSQVQLIDRDVDGDGVFGPLLDPDEPFQLRLVSRPAGAAPTDLAAGGDGDSASPDISDDGRYVAFNSEAPNLVDDADGSLFNQLPDCEGPCDAILVRDQFGTGPNEVASVAQFDPPQNSPSFNPPSISGTGRFVAFDTFADNLIAAGSDTNNANDVFVREFTPTLSAAPNPLNFGTVLIGDTDSLSVTMTHSGFGPVNPASITVTGTNPGDFAAGPNTCVGVTLHDGGQCIVSVLFTPGVTGTLNATLVIAFEGSGPPATVGLTGGAGPRVATLDLNPDELVFPEQRGLTPSPARTVTVTNTGTGSTLISSVTIQGANPGDFASTANTCAATVLAPGATCAVSITFTPTAIGARQAILRFNDDAVGGPHLVGLRGTGATPTLTISPAVIPPGGVVTVTGTNWPAVLPMLMEWADARPGTTTRFPERIRERTADGNGGLTATLVVFPNTTIGGRQLVGRVGAFTANVPLLVGRGSAQPGEFVIRR